MPLVNYGAIGNLVQKGRVSVTENCAGVLISRSPNSRIAVIIYFSAKVISKVDDKGGNFVVSIAVGHVS